jgi:hypothetical protein
MPAGPCKYLGWPEKIAQTILNSTKAMLGVRNAAKTAPAVGMNISKTEPNRGISVWRVVNFVTVAFNNSIELARAPS